MTKRIRRNNTGKTRSIDDRLIGSAYSYYGGAVRTSGEPRSSAGLKRVFAAALLSGASVLAVGLAGTGSAKAGSCTTIGTQVICTGSFEESVQYIGVEDLTVTLGAGSVIDTTDETSEGDFDNAGILVIGEDQISVYNNGSILTGDTGYEVGDDEEGYYWVYGGYRHHGIAAYSEYGDATVQNSAQGTIVTTSNHSHGAIAHSGFEEFWGGDALAVNHGLIGTEGDDSYGLVAVAKYTATVDNTGTIVTDGEGSYGIFASSEYDVYVSNSGAINTYGDYSHGIVVYVEADPEYSSTVEIDNSGSIATAGEYADGIRVSAHESAVTITNSGSISTEGDGSDGIWASGHSVSVFNSGDIVTDDEYSRGVSIEGHTVYLNNSGTIRTYGYESVAVEADSEGDDTTTIVNTGLIAAYGEDSDAIHASGPTVRITNTNVIEDDEVVQSGLIYAWEGRAISVEEAGDVYVVNDATIIGAIRIEADDYASVVNSGTISASEDGRNLVSVFVEEGDAVFVNNEDGLVTTTSDWATAVSLYAEEGFADLRNHGTITTGYIDEDDYNYGDGSIAAYAFGEEGALVLNTGTITTFGDEGAHALYAATDTDIAQALNTGTITTSGDNSHGVVANAFGDEVYVGYDDILEEPIYAEVGGYAIAGNTGSVQTSGENSYGVVAVSKYGDAAAYNILGGSIVTSGESAHGVVAATGVYLGDILQDGGYEGGSAFAVNGFPGAYLGEFILFPGFEEGHVSVSEFVDIEGFEPGDFRSTIVTTGDGAIGVLALSYGGEFAAAANFYGTITTGTMDEHGEALSGDYAYGVAAFAFSEGGEAAAMNKYHAHVTTHGDYAHGVIARAGGEAVAFNWLSSTVTTHGDYAYGIAAFSETGDARAANKYNSSIVTHGYGAHGLVVESGDVYWDGDLGQYVFVGGNVDALNIGSSIVTYGDYSNGIDATTVEGDVYVVNATVPDYESEDEEAVFEARIETFGEGSDAIYARAQEGGVYVLNAGVLVTHGEDSYGISAHGDTTTVVNYGSIYTYGEDSHGIYATSESILTTSVTNSGIIKVTGEESDGIRASGLTVNITNTEDGEIYSYDSDGIFVSYAESATVINHGTISYAGADGIDVNESSEVLIKNYGSITANESGIEASEGIEALVYNYGSITGRIDITEFDDVYFLNDADASVIVVAENSDEDGGVFIEAYGTVDVANRGNISVYSDDTFGVHLRGSTVSLDNSGTISTTGDYSHAVVALSNLPATTTITNSGTIEATGEYADAIVASGPSIFITNTEDGVISSEDGNAIYAFDTKYASIINHGDIYGDVIVVAESHLEYDASTYVLNTGLIDGDLDTSGGYSDDTIIVDGGRITGAIFTGDGTDEVTVQGEGVELGKGIHAGGEGEAHLTFAHDDEIVLDDGIEGWAISGFNLVDFDSGRVELDGFGIHTAGEEGTVNVAYGAVLATTGEGAHVAAAEVNIDGTLDIGLGGFFDVTGDVSFGGDSLFFTRVQDVTAGVVSGNTVTFAEGSTIFADVTGGLDAVVGEDILIASAGQEDGVTDHGALVEDNIFLFYFAKVMNGDIIDTGSADQLFLRVQIEETAFDTADDAGYTRNQLSIADALDVYLRTQPLSSPLVKWLAQFETEEEQRAELLKVIKDTLPEESNGSGTATIVSTDLIYDMIMDRLSGGGFAVAHSGQTGVAAGDAALGGSGKWAIWGRAGASTAKFTPGGVNGFDADSWGFTVGIDGEIATNMRAGIGGFYIASDVKENGAGANAKNDITGYGATAYMSYRPGAWYVNGALGFGTNEYDSQRRSIGGVNVASYDSTQFVARAEVGHMFTSGQWDITPNVGLRYNRVDIDGYTETGPLPISVNSQTVESLRAVAGVNARYSFLLEDGAKLIPEFGVKILGELANPDQTLTGSVVGGGAFAVQSVPRDDVSFGIGAGITWEVSDRFSLRVTYDGELQSDYDEHALAAAVRFAF